MLLIVKKISLQCIDYSFGFQYNDIAKGVDFYGNNKLKYSN